MIKQRVCQFAISLLTLFLAFPFYATLAQDSARRESSSRTGLHHPQAGFSIEPQREWKVSMTTRGVRLIRDDAVINVRLHSARNASRDAFFKAIGKPGPDGTTIRRRVAHTVELLGQSTLCGEYLTGTDKHDRRGFLTYAVFEGRGYSFSLDCSGNQRAERFEEFKQVIKSFRVTELAPILVQPTASEKGTGLDERSPNEKSPRRQTPTGDKEAGNFVRTQVRNVPDDSVPDESLPDDLLEVILGASGVSEVKREPPDGLETLFKMRAGKRIFGVLNDREFGQIRCYAFFKGTGEGVTDRRLRIVNAWNADNRFSKAFVYDNGSWVLESDLRYRRGFRPEAVMSHIARFAQDVPRFVRHVEKLTEANSGRDRQ